MSGLLFPSDLLAALDHNLRFRGVSVEHWQLGAFVQSIWPAAEKMADDDLDRWIGEFLSPSVERLGRDGRLASGVTLIERDQLRERARHENEQRWRRLPDSPWETVVDAQGWVGIRHRQTGKVHYGVEVEELDATVSLGSC